MTIGFDGIERRASGAPYQDGVLELFGSLLFAVVAAVWAVDQGIVMAWLAFPIILGLGRGMRWVKRRITEPRIGYAAPRVPPRDTRRGGFLYVAVALSSMVGLVALGGSVFDAEAWRRWAPYLAGALSAAGFWYAGSASRLIRFRFMAGFSALSGLVVSMVSDGTAGYRPVGIYALSMSVLLVLVGSVTLGRFLRSHPIHSGSATA